MPEGSEEAAEAIDGAVVARDFLDQILQGMAVPATVGAQRQSDGSVRLMVEGHDMGVVIGKHGTTINALQYLVGLVVQKRTGERTRLVIDAEGYRSRREQALKEMALTYAAAGQGTRGTRRCWTRSSPTSAASFTIAWPTIRMCSPTAKGKNRTAAWSSRRASRWR